MKHINPREFLLPTETFNKLQSKDYYKEGRKFNLSSNLYLFVTIIFFIIIVGYSCFHLFIEKKPTAFILIFTSVVLAHIATISLCIMLFYTAVTVAIPFAIFGGFLDLFLSFFNIELFPSKKHFKIKDPEYELYELLSELKSESRYRSSLESFINKKTIKDNDYEIAINVYKDNFKYLEKIILFSEKASNDIAATQIWRFHPLLEYFKWFDKYNSLFTIKEKIDTSLLEKYLFFLNTEKERRFINKPNNNISSNPNRKKSSEELLLTDEIQKKIKRIILTKKEALKAKKKLENKPNSNTPNATSPKGDSLHPNNDNPSEANKPKSQKNKPISTNPKEKSQHPKDKPSKSDNSNSLENKPNSTKPKEKLQHSNNNKPSEANKIRVVKFSEEYYINLAKKRIEIGEVGEYLALSFEKQRILKEEGASFLFHLEHSSKEIGDGLGYDITSIYNGQEIFIEVKTTTSSDSSNNIFFTSNELNVMNLKEDKYWLYRVFDCNIKEKTGKIQIIKGANKIKSLYDFQPYEYTLKPNR